MVCLNLLLITCLKQSCRALAAANAHCYDTVFCPSAQHLICNRSNHSRAGHAKRVPDGNRTAVYVQFFLVDREPVSTINNLYRKRLVKFPHIDIVNRESVTFEQLRNGKYRTYAHLIRLASRNRKASEDQLWCNPQRLRAFR